MSNRFEKSNDVGDHLDIYGAGLLVGLALGTATGMALILIVQGLMS